MRRFAVIPTRGYTKTLSNLVKSVKQAGATPIIIHPTGRITFIFSKSINIVRDQQNFQRWGNLGFQAAIEHGGKNSPVLMINDDIVISHTELHKIYTELETCDLISMDDRQPAATPMTGWLFGLRAGKIWMNEEYVWWYGDDDLWNRAIRQKLNVKLVNAEYAHHKVNRRTDKDWDPVFDGVAQADESLYWKTWKP